MPKQALGRLASCGHDDTRVRACLAQMVPLLREIKVKIGFRWEGLSPKPAMTAAKGEVTAFNERVNAAAAAHTVDIFRHEAGFRGALRDEPEPIGITGNPHFVSPRMYV